MLKRFLAGAMLALSAGQAHSYFYTGNDLVEHMREHDKYSIDHPRTNYYDVGAYIGFVAGVNDAHDAAARTSRHTQHPRTARHSSVVKDLSGRKKALPAWKFSQRRCPEESSLEATGCVF